MYVEWNSRIWIWGISDFYILYKHQHSVYIKCGINSLYAVPACGVTCNKINFNMYVYPDSYVSLDILYVLTILARSLPIFLEREYKLKIAGILQPRVG